MKNAKIYGIIKLSHKLYNNNLYFPIEDSAITYNVYRRLPGESWANRKPIITCISTQYTDKNLKSGQLYYYRITAVNECAEGEQSESLNVYTANVITYNVDGNINIISRQYKQNNIPLIIKNEIPTKNGYEFSGWNTMPDMSGTVYLPGSSYTAEKS